MTRSPSKFALASVALVSLLTVLSLTFRDSPIGFGATDQEPSTLPVIESFQLGNGLQVIAAPIPRAQRTVVMASYGVGSADDPAHLPGLAHYLEHVTFSALKSHDDDRDRSASTRAHRQLSMPEAFTSYDFTAYYHNVRWANVTAALEIEASRLARLNVDDAAVEYERNAVRDEREHDIERNPHALLEEKVRAVAFNGVPYGRPVVGTNADADRVTAEEAKRFWAVWYKPSNVTLVVTGDVRTEKLRPLVESYFAATAGTAPARVRPEPKITAPQRVQVDATAGAETLWTRSYIAPSFATSDHREVLSLQILARVLTNGHGGRLDRALKRRSLAREIVVEYVPDAIGATLFSFHGTLARNVDIPAFESSVETELAKLLSTGISQEEFATARQALAAEFASAMQDPLQAASTLGAALATGRNVTDIVRLPEFLSSIGVEDVRAAAAKLFTSSEVTGVASPAIQ